MYRLAAKSRWLLGLARGVERGCVDRNRRGLRGRRRPRRERVPVRADQARAREPARPARRREGRPRRFRGLAPGAHGRPARRGLGGRGRSVPGRSPRRRVDHEHVARPLRRLRGRGRAPVGVDRAPRREPHRSRSSARSRAATTRGSTSKSSSAASRTSPSHRKSKQRSKKPWPANPLDGTTAFAAGAGLCPAGGTPAKKRTEARTPSAAPEPPNTTLPPQGGGTWGNQGFTHEARRSRSAN